MKISVYLEELASSASTPGGGSASALGAQIGISLVEMAIALTKGKKKYADYSSTYEQVEAVLKESKEICKWGMDEDAVAFDNVMSIYRMKPSPAEQESYDTKLQEATIYAAQVPLKVAKAIQTALGAANEVKAILNPWVVSDLIGGMETLNGALRSVLLNVAINVNGLAECEERELLQTQMRSCLEESTAIYEEMKAYLYEIDTFNKLKI